MKVQGIFFQDFTSSYIPSILEEIYLKHVYQPFIEEKKTKVAIDIGANVGIWTFYAQQFCDRVISVEPAKEHFKVLQYMINFNNYTNVTPLNVALSHQSGKVKFYHCSNKTMYSLKQEVNDNSKNETVKAVTFDELFKIADIDYADLIKLDVEGSECEILSSQGFDKVADKIGTIVGEWHDWSNVTPVQLQTTLQDRGFKFRWLMQTDAHLFLAKK